MKKSQVNVGLIGYGVVGQGLVKVLHKHRALLEEKIGARMNLSWVCRRKAIASWPGGPRPKFTKDWRDVVRDPSVDIVVELIGGLDPARSIVLESIKAGKHVATANKALLAKHWGEIFTLAQERKSLVYFEAAVGGGIPVVQGLNEGLAANRIEKIYGILNGTTNYILTRMAEGMDFASALQEAQAAGFAEADPSFDIDGVDVAHKMAILASLATGGGVPVEWVHREGIRHLDLWDVSFARQKLGLTTKLLGLADVEKNEVNVRVFPALLPLSHPFANVSREYNGIFVHGDAVGDVMFYGRGAGQLATASAVVSDVMYLSRQVANATAGRLPYVSYSANKKLSNRPFNETISRHYLRFTTWDRPGVLARLTSTLAKSKISIESVHQESGDRRVPIVMVTHRASEGAVRSALNHIDRFPAMAAKTVHFRIVD